AALVPQDDSEMLFPMLEDRREGNVREPGASMQNQQHGIISILASDLQKLVDAPDGNKNLFPDTVGCSDTQVAIRLMLPECAISERQHKRGYQNSQNCQRQQPQNLFHFR